MLGLKFSNQSDKFLSKCDGELFLRISKRLENLRLNPIPSDSKFIRKEGNEKVFRVRVGGYRILYFVDYPSSKVYIEKIDKRNRVY